jgi:hypothetical protein
MFPHFVNSPASGALIGAYPCMFQFNWRVCSQSIAHLLVSREISGQSIMHAVYLPLEPS